MLTPGHARTETPGRQDWQEANSAADGEGEAGGGNLAAPLKFTELTGDPTFDPLANPRFLWQMLRQAVLFGGFFLLAETAVGIFCLVLAIAGLGFGPAFSLWDKLSVVAWLALLLLYWLMPVSALLAQSSRLLRFSRVEAQAMLEQIERTFDRHETPRDTLKPRRISPPGEGRREYLELRRKPFSGIISCFPHGLDLYVGWTFWIYMSPLRLMIMFILRKIENLAGHGSEIHQTLRYESTRATIAAIDSSVSDVIAQAGGTGEPGRISLSDSHVPPPPSRMQDIPSPSR
jgi:hypothetical protein